MWLGRGKEVARVRRFKSCEVRIWDKQQYLETVFDDGTKVPAAPHDSTAYLKTAQTYGYAGDTWALCREHEMAHTVLAELLGLEYSPALWSVAHGTRTPWSGAVWSEEEMVLAFQRWRRFKGDPIDAV